MTILNDLRRRKKNIKGSRQKKRTLSPTYISNVFDVDAARKKLNRKIKCDVPENNSQNKGNFRITLKRKKKFDESNEPPRKRIKLVRRKNDTHSTRLKQKQDGVYPTRSRRKQISKNLIEASDGSVEALNPQQFTKTHPSTTNRELKHPAPILMTPKEANFQSTNAVWNPPYFVPQFPQSFYFQAALQNPHAFANLPNFLPNNPFGQLCAQNEVGDDIFQFHIKKQQRMLGFNPNWMRNTLSRRPAFKRKLTKPRPKNFDQMYTVSTKEENCLPEVSDELPEFRTIAIRQPWAEAILRGWKKIENREKNIPVSMRNCWLALYVSRKFGVAERNQNGWKGRSTNEALKQTSGKLAGIVRFSGSVDYESALEIDNVFTMRTPHHWKVTGVFPLEQPIPYSCNLCWTRVHELEVRKTLTALLRKHNLKQPFIPIPKKIAKKVFRCNFCQQTRSKKISLEKHLREAHGTRFYEKQWVPW